jgi:spore coat polysaccharide biosynthesis protein SpsF (cytidylyltransferase family)
VSTSSTDHKVLLGIQSRTGSKRFPRKVLQFIGPKPLLKWVYDSAYEAERQLRAKRIESRAAVLGPEMDLVLKKFCDENLMKSYFPLMVDENNLIQRYFKACKLGDFTHVVRITADCWQMQPELIVEITEMMLREKVDYVCNTINRSFIEGLDLQACSKEALEWFVENQKTEVEHPFIEFDKNEIIGKQFEADGFKYLELINPKAEWTIRTSIDSELDLKRANEIYEKCQEQGLFRQDEKCIGAGPASNEQ